MNREVKSKAAIIETDARRIKKSKALFQRLKIT